MDPGLTIVLLGHSGVGKSASGNTILGRPAFESRRSFRSVTTQISSWSENVFGKQITVVDTPGILECEREIQTRCEEYLKSVRPCLFLVVVKVDRFTIEQRNAVEACLRVIGDQQLSSCYLLFTGGDDLNNMSLDQFINDDPEGPLPPVVERFEGRHHLFNNEHGGQEQVRELLERSGHVRTAGELQEKRVVLLGLPGHGKSSSGNTILGSSRFEAAGGFEAVTRETVCKSATVEGRRLKVVDTPGFTGKVLTPRKLFEEIMKSVAKASPGPHAFIIVVKIDRTSDADIKLFKMMPKLFSRDASKNTMVLFTYGDNLGCQSIEDLIRSCRPMSKLVSMCGHRYCVFDNRRTGNRQQVRSLLDKIDEMVSAGGRQYYTSDMFYSTQRLDVKIAIKWHQLGEWFKRKLRRLDAHQDGYMELAESVDCLNP